MELGPFSMLLSIKDLKVSKDFYEKLGFIASFPDKTNNNWCIMKNGNTEIGIFQGMFEENTLCFNPGGKLGKPIKDFTDIREIYKELKTKGIEAQELEGLDNNKGPAGFVIVDPDGNEILIEKHID